MGADKSLLDELASVIWETSRADEGTISATGAQHVARSVVDYLESLMTPGRWWRVLDEAGELWAETSDSAEAVRVARPRDRLQREYSVTLQTWKEET